MCGIFGYVGKRTDAEKIVFEGIKSLEYRGYDSWGIVAKQEPRSGNLESGKLIAEKHAGKIGDARLSVVDRPSSIALGHTRWATHGGVLQKNAHPHFDCEGKIAVVHNGIIENFQELKASLTQKHKFKSQTDTEVVVHLVEELAIKYKLEEAIRRAFLRVRGLNAFIFLPEDGEIVAIKSGSPRGIGVGRGENFLASDPSALLPYTKDVIYVKDGEMVRILANKVTISRAKSKEIVKSEISRLDWSQKVANKGKYKHFFLKEVYEQPQILGNISNEQRALVSRFTNELKRGEGIFLVACGSAANSALAGVYLFSKVAKKHLNFAFGSEFKYLEDYISSKSLVLAISQSGESVDVIEPVISAKKRGAQILSIVNTEGSTLWRTSKLNFPLKVGPEKAVVATKSYIAMVGVIMLLGFSSAGRGVYARKLLRLAANSIDRILEKSYLEKVKNLAKLLAQSDHAYMIGRGISYASALEAALKLKETAYIHAEGFAGGELKHGVIALVERGTPCIVFAPNDETYDDVISNAIEIKSRGGYIIGVSPENNDAFDFHLQVADCREASIIANTVPVQLLAYFMALEKGLDPDMPRNLAKSVTVK